MVMRGDQEPAFPEEQAIFLAHGVFPGTFATGTQRDILLHDKAPEERRPLFPFQILGNSLEVLPARTFRDKAGFMPKVLGGLDVVLDDERAITQLAGQRPGEKRIGRVGPDGSGRAITNLGIVVGEVGHFRILRR